MNKFIALLVCAISTLNLFAQQVTKPKLSPHTKKYVSEQQTRQKNHQYMYKKGNDGNLYISALIKVADENTAQKGIESLGAVIGTKAGKVWTVKVPADKFIAFTKLSGISYIQMDEPVKPNLNVVRMTTHADSVQKGINLALPYSGKNVIVGVIDFGFDYHHPTFYDTLGTRYRIKKVWELNGTGTPPAGYNYGNELTDTLAIKARNTDNPQQTHGSGVAGIAAGSGYGSPVSNTKFRGMAYDADMVFVGVRRDSIEQEWLEGGFSDFIDGINYIFRYAEKEKKPAVVNISWGSQSGPHDGSTLFNEACNNLSGSGKIIVMSAGNEGEEKIHLSKTFTATDTLLQTFLDFTPATYKRTWVDVWGESDKTFCGAVTLYRNGVAGNSTGVICIDDETHSFNLISENGTDTCTVDIITSAAEYNGKPRVTLSVFNHSDDSVGITLKGTDGTIHAWDEYYYYGYTNGYQSAFSSHGYNWAEDGNTTTTVSDMGSGESILLVGAYASKVSYTDLNSLSYSYSGYVKPGQIVPFSSHGPMIDGRVKPDITAPGLTIATAYNSFDPDYSATGSKSSSLVSSFTNPADGRKYYFGEFTGTSASSPVAAGVVALLLQANPYLFPSHIKSIFTQTAITDASTGTLPAEGNNLWGHGKINAYGALQKAILILGVNHYAGQKLDCAVYPNPTRGDFSLDYAGQHATALNIEVLNMSGSTVLTQQWEAQAGLNTRNLTLSDIPSGLYLVKVSSDSGLATIKLLVE